MGRLSGSDCVFLCEHMQVCGEPASRNRQAAQLSRVALAASGCNQYNNAEESSCPELARRSNIACGMEGYSIVSVKCVQRLLLNSSVSSCISCPEDDVVLSLRIDKQRGGHLAVATEEAGQQGRNPGRGACGPGKGGGARRVRGRQQVDTKPSP